MNPLLFKADIIHGIRNFLRSEGFVEFATPVVRRHDCDGMTHRVKLYDGRFLRESPALALRYNLGIAKRVFEIGPCFRDDKPDATHAPEFTMLDLYARDETCTSMRDLAERLVRLFYRNPVAEVSLATLIRDRFGVDFFNDEEADARLFQALKTSSDNRCSSYAEYLDEFIKQEIEPMSIGRCNIVVDFPLTTEALAKKRAGTAAIADRFEFQIDGIEVVHGYEDEPDVQQLARRAKRLERYGQEDEIMMNCLKNGVVPPNSSGFGIGIERLCQVCLEEADIGQFLASAPFR